MDRESSAATKSLPRGRRTFTVVTRSSGEAPAVTTADGVFERFARLQARHPAGFVAAGLLAILLFALAARGLTLRPAFEELLPEGAPSVVELRRVLQHVAGTGRIFVVLEGGDAQTLRNAADAIAPRLRAVGPPWVGGVESGVQRGRAFLVARGGFFATEEQLRDLSLRIDQRLTFAEFPDSDDEAIDPQKVFAASVSDPFPSGYFEAKDGKALVLVIRSAVAPGQIEEQREALRRVQAAVAAALPPGVTAGYAGDLVTGLFEYGAALDDLLEVGGAGLLLVLAAIVLFYRRLRPLLAMAITLAAGLAGSFAFARLAVGHLNAASGFLFSIIAGNGINPGILYQARYLEERGRGLEPEDAAGTALRASWRGTLTAALAAAGAYGALGVTRFRGFRDFALIGAAGMIICWLATMAILPATLAGLDRLREMRQRGLLARLGLPELRYEAPFVFAVSRAPRALAAVACCVTLAGAAITARWILKDPLEYDLGKLQSARDPESGLYRVSAMAASILGAGREGSMVVLCDRPDQVDSLRKVLLARKAKAPPGLEPFGALHALQDFVPPDQEAKLPLIQALRRKLLRLRPHLGAAEWARIEPWLPPEDLRPFGLADLPDDLAAPFSERDGTRGRLLFIEPTEGQSDRDLRYLIRWSDAFRETVLPSGEVVRGSGTAVLYADMLRVVAADAPIAFFTAFLTTAIAVTAALGAGRTAQWTLASLVAGLLWLGGALGLAGVRIHFLNFMALPITLGVGVDYAVNLMQRVREKHETALSALRGSGGAIVLCSLTTTLGYLALLRSRNQGVASLGLTAALGEVCVLLSAVLALPAALIVVHGTRAAGD
jgi:predicted RND superfamily exporter protein